MGWEIACREAGDWVRTIEYTTYLVHLFGISSAWLETVFRRVEVRRGRVLGDRETTMRWLI